MLILIDECVDVRIENLLRLSNHKIVTLKDLGLSNIGYDDADVIAEANTLGASVVTCNVNDFKTLFNDGRALRSVILLRKPRWMDVDSFATLVSEEMKLRDQEPRRLIWIGFGMTPPVR